MLECQALSYRHLLENISLCFNPGEIHAILGPNGAGKSTLLKALAGIWAPTQGKVCWLSTPLTLQNRQAWSGLITLIPQSPNMTFEYTVEEFVGMGRYLHPTSGSVSDYLKRVDVLPFSKRALRHLSQGERQRVYIARALATEATVLLFDEPTANLDINHQLQIWELIQQLAQEGKIIVVANHDLSNSRKICSHAAILQGGHCVAFGDYQKVVTSQIIENVFLVSPSTSGEFILHPQSARFSV